MGRCRSKREGFTLLEMVAVVVVLGVLTFVATVSYIQFSKSGEKTATRVTLNSLRSDIARVAADTGGTFPVAGTWPLLDVLPADTPQYLEPTPAGSASPTAGTGTVSVIPADESTLALAMESGSATCELMAVDVTGAAVFATYQMGAGSCTAQRMADCILTGSAKMENPPTVGKGTKTDPYELPSAAGCH